MGPLFMHGVSLLSLTTLQPGSCSSTIPLPHRPTLFPVLSAALCEYNSRDLDGTTQLSNGHTKHGAVPEAWGLALVPSLHYFMMASDPLKGILVAFKTWQLCS